MTPRLPLHILFAPFIPAIAMATAVDAGSRAPADAAAVVVPWVEPGDVALPEWAKSVAPRGDDVVLFQHPTTESGRRGVAIPGTRLPLLGAVRGPECGGRWLLVGASAWICNDGVELSAEEPSPPTELTSNNGLLYTYFVVGNEGVTAYGKPGGAEEPAVEELDAGRVVAITMRIETAGQAWGRTTGNLWVPLATLHPTHPSLFHGEPLASVEGAPAADPSRLAWATADKTMVFHAPQATGKPVRTLRRLEPLSIYEEFAAPKGVTVRISADGVEPPEWVRASEVGRITLASPPEEVGGAGARERWIDVSLSAQTLVAYEGVRPVFATLVSTGHGGPDTETPLGVHRIWVKLVSSTMSNDGDEDVESRYTLDDVPWVQFFAKGVALHGAYWHGQFGRPVSHGCVNLSPRDAEWLFRFTAPHPPPNFRAVYPTENEGGTVVRVRP